MSHRRRPGEGRGPYAAADVVRAGWSSACPSIMHAGGYWPRPSPGRREYLQLPRVRERERTHPPRILVEDQRTRDRRLGALAAILALAEPAVDADGRALGILQIHAGGINELRGMPDLAAEPD